MNFLSTKELQAHAMKAKYGFLRFVIPTTKAIKKDAWDTSRRIRMNGGRGEEQTSAKMDFIRKYPVKD